MTTGQFLMLYGLLWIIMSYQPHKDKLLAAIMGHLLHLIGWMMIFWPWMDKHLG